MFFGYSVVLLCAELQSNTTAIAAAQAVRQVCNHGKRAALQAVHSRWVCTLPPVSGAES